MKWEYSLCAIQFLSVMLEKQEESTNIEIYQDSPQQVLHMQITMVTQHVHYIK